jgi:cell division protein FtsL
LLEHNTRIAKLSTRIAELHHQLNDLQKKESVYEEKFINQMDLKRLNVRFDFDFDFHLLFL